jgi:hypothetical protein
MRKFPVAHAPVQIEPLQIEYESCNRVTSMYTS